MLKETKYMVIKEVSTYHPDSLKETIYPVGSIVNIPSDLNYIFEEDPYYRRIDANKRRKEDSRKFKSNNKNALP